MGSRQRHCRRESERRRPGPEGADHHRKHQLPPRQPLRVLTKGANMRNSILRALIVPVFLAVAYGAQLCSQEPFSESFGFSSEDFGGGSYLGVDTRDITADRLGDLKLKEEHGVEVTLVDQDAPAGKAGLKEHDVILTINGSQAAATPHDPRDSARTRGKPRHQPGWAADDSEGPARGS